MRLHLFEWHDQVWFPISLRTAMTSYLTVAYGTTSFPKLWASCLSKVMSRNGATEIVDLGSGSGGPVGRVVKELEKSGFKVCVTLTDLYPNVSGLRFQSVGASSIRYWPEPVDATRVPAALHGIRTMFTLFHHFRPQAARGILRVRLSSDARSAFSKEHRERRLQSHRRYSFLCLFFCSRLW